MNSLHSMTKAPFYSFQVFRPNPESNREGPVNQGLVHHIFLLIGIPSYWRAPIG
jgi:hypothetical protein